jgi:peptidoglycan hydrolase-like protein with peptidoglycan-binding domain
VFHTLYEGDIASVEPDDGQGLVIHCVGVIYRMDLLKEPPILTENSWDRGYILERMFNHKRHRYNLHIGRMARVTTGITGVTGGDFSPTITGAAQDTLADMTTDTFEQYTIKLARPRTPVLALKDTTTVHATVSYGAPGVTVKLSRDFTSATTSVFASGSNGHCTWMGARFPNYRGRDVPAFPLTPGNVFSGGDGQAGFAPFSNFLRAGDYGSIFSHDTYSAADIAEVEEFQDRAGITVDGVVGAQTWEAAFQPGANAGSLIGAYVAPIYEKTVVRKWLYDEFGSEIGGNPNYDPTVPVVQDYIPFGNHTPKHLGRRSAKQIVHRSYPAGLTGTITLESDPTERSRWDLYAGQNVELENFHGGSVLLHIVRRERNWQTGTVTLSVDEKARDLLTVGAIHERDRDIADLTRRPKFGRTRSKVFNDYGQWLCEDGAGEYPLENLQGGFWNVQRIAAAPKGTIERISFAAGTGLTEQLLDQNLSDDPPASIPGASRFVLMMFTSAITANRLASLLPHPLTANSDGSSPVDAAEDALNKHGKIYASGGPGNANGFFPKGDPGDGTNVGLTGRHEDGGGLEFGPTNHYWLWIATWSPVSTKIGGRIFPGAPA